MHRRRSADHVRRVARKKNFGKRLVTTNLWDESCFKFGGLTSGGLPEVMVVNLPYSKCNIIAEYVLTL